MNAGDIMIAGKRAFEAADKSFLASMLADAGIEIALCHVTHAIGAYRLAQPKRLGLPISGHVTFRSAYEHDSYRLLREVHKIKPKLIITLGQTALWGVTGYADLRRYVGRLTKDHALTGARDVLATYCPAYVARNPETEPLVREHFTRIKFHVFGVA